MMSSWDSYYIVFLSALLSLSVPGVLALISFVFFPKGRRKSDAKTSRDLAPSSSKTILGQRVNVRFFLAANAALVLIALALELIPSATTLQTENREGLLKGLVAIVSIASFSVLGLLYSVRKGDMGWLSSYQSKKHPERKRR
jgi:hypothetical protein